MTHKYLSSVALVLHHSGDGGGGVIYEQKAHLLVQIHNINKYTKNTSQT